MPSGLGSPSTTLRRSATFGSATSRSQLMPNRCLPSVLAPALKSAITATLRSTMHGIGQPTGPSEPGPAPITARISASSAKRSGAATSGSLTALNSFSTWSPRTSRATKSASHSSEAATTRVLTVFSIGWPNCVTRSSMVRASGVSTTRIASPGAGRSPAGATASASSTLAAKSDPVEKAIWSSPESAST